MNFKSKGELLLKLRSFRKIGEGSQGVCYLDKNSGIVYKIFNQVFDDSLDSYLYYYKYNRQDIMKFGNIKNNTYIFPSNVIYVQDEIVGYIEPYVNSKDLTKISPLRISLDKLITNINKVRIDIEKISECGILTRDVMYNILYKNKFNVIDTDDYVIKDVDPSTLIDMNNQMFDYAIYDFLIDNFFNDFVDSYTLLKNMYKDRTGDVTIFIKYLRKYLSEYVGYEINKLGDAKECVDKVKALDPCYIRDIKLK